MDIEPIAQILILRFGRKHWRLHKAVMERLRDEVSSPRKEVLSSGNEDLMAVTRRTYPRTPSELGEGVDPHLSGGDSGSRPGAS